MKFELGNLVASKSIVVRSEKEEEFFLFIRKSIGRYLVCDWGELDGNDKWLNDLAVANKNDRILAKYTFNDDNIYIITEYDRSVTTIIFDHEY